jgi:hypothetical protein
MLQISLPPLYSTFEKKSSPNSEKFFSKSDDPESNRLLPECCNTQSNLSIKPFRTQNLPICLEFGYVPVIGHHYTSDFAVVNQKKWQVGLEYQLRTLNTNFSLFPQRIKCRVFVGSVPGSNRFVLSLAGKARSSHLHSPGTTG